jgi:dTDP-glucose 4,6-dehydratase
MGADGFELHRSLDLISRLQDSLAYDLGCSLGQGRALIQHNHSMNRTISKKGQTKKPQPTSVITGGAGFLGSHLGDYLLERGHKVVAIDNFVTGSVDNIAHQAGNKDFKFIEQDVTEFLFLDRPVDYVWHFASPASPIDYLEIPIQTLKVGSLGTHKALGLAKMKSARFLLASTSEIYGDPLVHPQSEEYWGNVSTIGPRGCYDESKRFAEALVMAYHREHAIDTKIVRIFNTYGPRMRLNDGRVVPAFISQALKNKPVTVFGEGQQTRSFCYYSDLIEGIYRLMMSETNEPVNIGNPAEMTVLEFAREIISAVGSRSKIVFNPLPQDDPKRRQPTISRAKALLRWEPRVTLAEGLVKTIAYFRGKI